MAIDSADKVAGLKKISSVIKARGALVGIQLVHVGGKTTSELIGGPLLAPSSIATPVKGRTLEIPQAMTSDQIELWVGWFVEAAKIATLAGFNIVELRGPRVWTESMAITSYESTGR